MMKVQLSFADMLFDNDDPILIRRLLCQYVPDFEQSEILLKYNQGVLQRREIVSEQSLSQRLEWACQEGFWKYTGRYLVSFTAPVYRKDTQIALARAAAIVEAIGNYILDKGINWREYTPFEEAVAWLVPNYDQYFPKGHQYLPQTAIRLKEQVLMRYVGKKEKGKERQQSPMPITEVIHLPRQGNRGTAKRT